MAKKFLCVALGVLSLAAAFHLGARNAGAFSGEVAASWGWATTPGGGMGYVVTTNGDVYQVNMAGTFYSQYLGNALTGSTATEKSSWGGIKGKFRE